jgi:IclR family transcriptional regulator, pca regulon regulatory protein
LRHKISSEKTQVAALANGLRAIEAFAASSNSLRLTDVANRSGLTRATARRYLHTLCALGFTEFDGKWFRLTPRVLNLGYSFISQTPLPKLAGPILEILRQRTHETASLSVLDGTDVVFLAFSTFPRATNFVSVGSRLPAFNSSAGRVLIAGKRDAEVERMLAKFRPPRRVTPKAKISAEDIMRTIQRVRIDGYAVNDEEIEIGVSSVAVPVLAATGAVIAAITLGLSNSRSRPKAIREFLPLLRAASQELAGMVEVSRPG